MSRVDEVQRAVLETVPAWGKAELWLRVLFEKQANQGNKQNKAKERERKL
jgi:hypothetical protein